MKKFIAGFVTAIAVAFAIPYVVGLMQNIGLIKHHVEIEFDLHRCDFELEDAYDISDFIR